MEMNLPFKVNIDYEYELFDIPGSRFKINNELEYLYLLVGDAQRELMSSVSYEKEYLRYLEEQGFQLPAIVPMQQKYENWWGHLKDRSLERKLNSKLTSFELAKKLKLLHFSSKIVTTNEQLLDAIAMDSNDNWILKDPHLFSGKGFIKFKRSNAHKLIINKKLILEHWLERTLDFGAIYMNGDNIYRHLNIIDGRGGYKGTVCASDSRNLFGDKLPIDEFESISNELLQIGAVDQFSIDSFFYREKGKIKCLPLVEVNYRKTLGFVAHKLREKFKDCFSGLFLIPKKELNCILSSIDCRILSPNKNYYKLIYIGDNSKDGLKLKLKNLNNLVKSDYLAKFLINF